MKATRQDVKAIFDYLLGRQINLHQARSRLLALGLQPGAELELFLAGHMSYDDAFKSLGV